MHKTHKICIRKDNNGAHTLYKGAVHRPMMQPWHAHLSLKKISLTVAPAMVDLKASVSQSVNNSL